MRAAPTAYGALRALPSSCVAAPQRLAASSAVHSAEALCSSPRRDPAPSTPQPIPADAAVRRSVSRPEEHVWKRSEQLRRQPVDRHVESEGPVRGDTTLRELLSPRAPASSPKSHGVSATESALLARQYALEESSVSTAVERYLRDAESARQRGDVLSSRPAIRLIMSWHYPLTLSLRRFLETINAPSAGQGKRSSGRRPRSGRHPHRAGPDTAVGAANLPAKDAALQHLKGTKADVLAAVVVHEVLAALMRDLKGVPLANVATAVGNAVRAEINLTKLRELRRLAAAAEHRMEEHTSDLGALSEANPGTASFDPMSGDGVSPSEWANTVHGASDSAQPLDSFGDATPATKRKRRRKKSSGHEKDKMFRTMNLPSGVSAINYAATQADVADAQWSPRDTIVVGSALIDLLISAANVEVSRGGKVSVSGSSALQPVSGPSDSSAPDVSAGGNSKIVPAFRHNLVYNPRAMKKVGTLCLDDDVLSLLMEDDKNLREYIRPKMQPMVVQPRPWVSPNAGPYLSVPTKLVRAHPSKALDDALAAADLQPVYEGLNALGQTAWKVNAPVLKVAKTLWSEKRAVAGLVSRIDLPMPSKSDYVDPEPVESVSVEDRASMPALGEGSPSALERAAESRKSGENIAGVRSYKRERRKVQKVNRELFSLRAHTGYQLDQADEFVDEERIYLPHNVDFRGRAYPVPVYLQHMGADLMRSMLAFAGRGEPLGERGVFWLKVHLANLLGGGKLSFQERIALAEDALPRALATASDPLSDANLEWWGNAEDPFQLLAACFEFGNGLGRYGNESTLPGFHSRLPVSMDGSCNGLQHYAALGRDSRGGMQVNLIPSDRPQDVYIGVAEAVQERVAEAAAKGDRIAKFLDGKVTRKVVKQTVMTSVYGVTLIGARAQIDNRLREIGGIPEEDSFAAALQLARWTLSSLGDIFSGASRTMDWLSASAKAVSRQGSEVQWLTPLGLPVIQPYRKLDSYMVKTAVQRVKVGFTGDHMPISRARQQSAFAPNFVHSVDSSHMLLTAVDCREKGIAFAAVHDSFWTHAATVDDMNKILRDTFVRLHTRELLVELRDSLLMRHRNIRLPPLPERGDLDLQEVLRAPYFFS